METIRVAVCDDEANMRSVLVSLVRCQDPACEITEYADANAYLQDKREHDLLFLDIELGGSQIPDGINGMDSESTKAPGALNGVETGCSQVLGALNGVETGCSQALGALNGVESGSSQALGALNGVESGSSQAPGALNGVEARSTKAPGALNGMELARKLRQLPLSRQPVIIFVTGYDRYVYQAFDVEAFQYLLKPVDEARFAQVYRGAVEKIASCERQRGRPLVIQSAGVNRVVALEDLYYIESQSHKLLLHLKDGCLEYYGKMGDLERELEGRFARIHKGYLVNLAYVEAYTRSEVVLADGIRLMISKRKHDAFAKAHLQFLRQ